MDVLKLTADVDPDGTIHLFIPGSKPGDRYDLAVVLNLVSSVPVDERGWPIGYFDQTFGSIMDPEFAKCDDGFDVLDPGE